jgi:hypothetical protein
VINEQRSSGVDGSHEEDRKVQEVQQWFLWPRAFRQVQTFHKASGDRMSRRGVIGNDIGGCARTIPRG